MFRDDRHQLIDQYPCIVLCGPTATGKTNLALRLAKLMNGAIVSADSRQLYTYMDIGTGKDIPSGFSSYQQKDSTSDTSFTLYSNGQITLWGYDIAKPDAIFGVYAYGTYMRYVVDSLRRQQILPIIVGGSGQYLESIFHIPPTSGVPINSSLRKKLQHCTAQELLAMLSTLNNQKAQSLNVSDSHNPRRLIRAIEIETYSQKTNAHPPKDLTQSRPFVLDSPKQLWIGLYSSNRVLYYKEIDNRVEMRIQNGFDAEVESLLRMVYKDPVLTNTIGYHEWILYKEGHITKEEATAKWKFAEHAYARRQMTWFRKYPWIHWYDIESPQSVSDIIEDVGKWKNQFK